MRSGTAKTDVRLKYGPLVNCIADLLGPSAEVVLHDVSHTDHSVVLIRNGHVTGRSVGAPLTDLGFYMLRESDRRIDTLGVYHSKTGAGKLLRCNAVNLRDSHRKIEAILCINIDVAGENESAGEKSNSRVTEHYETSIKQVIQSMIADASAARHGDLTPEAKFEVVRALDNRGVFLARGAVNQVAVALSISRPTVYKYIQKARRSRGVLKRPRKPKRPRHRRAPKSLKEAAV
jgi:predicted transcriptional regulator YheO